MITLEDGAIRKTTQAVDVEVRAYVLKNKTDNESFNDVLRRFFRLDDDRSE